MSPTILPLAGARCPGSNEKSFDSTLAVGSPALVLSIGSRPSGSRCKGYFRIPPRFGFEATALLAPVAAWVAAGAGCLLPEVQPMSAADRRERSPYNARNEFGFEEDHRWLNVSLIPPLGRAVCPP